jgi:hypothetical protein
MRISIIILLLSPLSSLLSQSFQWTYLPIDSSKQKWGDWAEPQWLRYFGLDFGDVDRDGLMDVVSGRYVYHNPGGDMAAQWPRTVLDDNVDAIFVADVDGDPFADIIAQALPNLYWYEAVDEKASLYRRNKIGTVPATSHVNSQGFEKADIIAGRKTEFLIAGNGNVYAIEIPEDPAETSTWKIQLIAANTSDEGIGVGDLDGDGDLDISCGRRPDGEDEPKILVWFENPGHIDAKWDDHVVGHTDHPIDRIEIADLNGDGQADIALAEERYPGLEPDGSLFWFAARQDLRKEWQKHLIVTQYSSNNLDLADLDKDGDVDLLTGEHKGQALELQLWENDGSGNFRKQVLDTGKENHLGTKWVDLDADGDLDIVGAGWDNYRWMHVWRNDDVFLLQKREAVYEGTKHFVVKAGGITYYYDQQGGGFSRIIDEEGNDWVGFKREPWGDYPASAAAAFRGLPNLVFQGDDDGAGHPGHQKCRSWWEGDRIITESLSGKWRWTWEFGPNYARLDILQTDPERPYWFLYEGTPGGKYQPGSCYFGHNQKGPLRDQYDFFKEETHLGRYRWMYTGQDQQERIFYLVHLNQDEKGDIISYLGNSEAGIDSQDGMTVWGFGRDTETHPLLSGPQQFVIGFYPHSIQNEKQHQLFTQFIQQQFLSQTK